MSATAPVVAQQLEPGMECERCANQNFPEHKPAVASAMGLRYVGAAITCTGPKPRREALPSKPTIMWATWL